MCKFKLICPGMINQEYAEGGRREEDPHIHVDDTAFSILQQAGFFTGRHMGDVKGIALGS